MLQGLSFIHSCNIFHRDLKPQNILMNSKGDVKLADFGLARTFTRESQSYSQNVVTLWYRAPELLVGTNCYNQSIDIWSVGCIFFELLTGKVLFRGTCVNSQLVAIFKILGIPSAEEFPPVASITFQNKNEEENTGEVLR